MTSTPREELDRVIELVTGTTRELGIDGWYAKNGASRPDSCSLGGDEEGTSYSWDLWAEPGADRSADAHRVADYWRSLGMTVNVVETNAWPMVFGEGGPVLRAGFDTFAANHRYSVGALARCTPGNYIDLIDEDNASRRRGELLPGDEFIREGDFPPSTQGWPNGPDDPSVDG